MNNTPENRVKAEIKKYLDTLKPDLFYFAVPASAHGKAGIADIICCYKGMFLAIEIKSKEAYDKPNHNMSPAQCFFRIKVAEASSELRYLCACNVEQVKNTIICLRT